jgi:hypothetical protein
LLVDQQWNWRQNQALARRLTAAIPNEPGDSWVGARDW